MVCQYFFKSCLIFFQMKDVLLVANEKEEFFVDELAQILREEGKTFEYAIGREEAIQKMDDFKVVYIPDLRIDLGSQKYSPLECYEVFGGVVYSHFDRLVASMVEIVMTARKTSKLLLHTTGFLMKHFLDILKP